MEVSSVQSPGRSLKGPPPRMVVTGANLPGSLEAVAGRLPSHHYRSAVLVNVLEHIEDDVSALHELYRILEPGGALSIFVPALPALYSELDRIFGHFRRYTGRELREKVKNVGFEAIDLRYFDLLGVLPWWLINRVMGTTEFHDGLARTYDRFFVPLGRGLESLARPPIGKNLLCIARRPIP